MFLHILRSKFYPNGQFSLLDETILKRLEEQKKTNWILKTSLLQTKKAGKGKGKSGAKGAKKVAASGSKGRGKKNLRKSPNNEPRKLLLTLATRRRRTRGQTRPNTTFSHVSSQQKRVMSLFNHWLILSHADGVKLVLIP